MELGGVVPEDSSEGEDLFREHRNRAAGAEGSGGGERWREATVLTEINADPAEAPCGDPEISLVFKGQTRSIKRPSPGTPHNSLERLLWLRWRAGEDSADRRTALHTVSLKPLSLYLLWPFFLVDLHLVFIPHCLGSSLECINHLASKQTAGPPKEWKIKLPKWV